MTADVRPGNVPAPLPGLSYLPFGSFILDINAGIFIRNLLNYCSGRIQTAVVFVGFFSKNLT